ncbi:hypothetical protein Psal006b_00488 [Piscirickettsia salmonis]|uniref:Recombination factor protein RarA n=1 Tax=Piscirickettsia salmonis TaxID=1238 RepID=A0A1L6TEN7_PISSA|nr:hypothetical protein [Piscirickettsia salmonis]AKP72638.1 hypothetical protein PSLF89_496 [Piscirickettsia salmonis LF-89 = ATCC VR-1361]ALB23870.1 recombination factor protein RarA [Piscirickettsia salmonis]ALY03708.1 hypothetical protein AWE47_13265 [Piscirickettsia salmonis]AMA43271.1 hypothetical protein AWJ11_13490 [Piscirickettsia salmonis]AOS35741.1 hypothetical protein AVM72_10610 [Piscirickettsia salmonis]
MPLDDLIKLSESKRKSLEVGLDSEVLDKTDEKFHKSLKYLAAYLSQKNRIAYQLAIEKDGINSLENHDKIPHKIDYFQQYVNKYQGYDISKIVADDLVGKIFTDYFKSTNHFKDPLEDVKLVEEEIIMPETVKDETEAQLEEGTIKIEKVTQEAPLVTPEPLETIIFEGLVEQEKKQKVSPKPALSEEEERLNKYKVVLDQEALKKITDSRIVEALNYLAKEYSRFNKLNAEVTEGDFCKSEAYIEPSYINDRYLDTEGNYNIDLIFKDEKTANNLIFGAYIKNHYDDLYEKFNAENKDTYDISSDEKTKFSQFPRKESTGSIVGVAALTEQVGDLEAKTTRADSMESLTEKSSNSIEARKGNKLENDLKLKILTIVTEIERLAKAKGFSTQNYGTSKGKVLFGGKTYEGIPDGFSEVHAKLKPLAKGGSLEEMNEAIKFAQNKAKEKSCKSKGNWYCFFYADSRSQQTIDQYKKLDNVIDGSSISL